MEQEWEYFAGEEGEEKESGEQGECKHGRKNVSPASRGYLGRGYSSKSDGSINRLIDLRGKCGIH